MRKPLVHSDKTFVIVGAFAVLFLAYFAFALPQITFRPPTLSDNATSGSNWAYVNLTSSESLNQSFLQWGNSSGFTNISMPNSSMTNWYKNMTGLADGTYNYTVWAQNTTGTWNQTGRRFVYIDTTPPYSLYACQDLTISGGSYILVQNVSSPGTCFNILADNITLDGNGYTINYSTSSDGYAINNSGGYDNITIKNLKIVHNVSVLSTYAIYAYNMTGGIITNNTLILSYMYWTYIHLDFSDSNTISNNTFSGSTMADHVHLNRSNGNAVMNNTITSSSGHGIWLESSNGSTISNNTITTTSGYGIYIASSNASAIRNNAIATSTGYGIDIIDSTGANMSGNRINATSAIGLYIEESTELQNYNHTIDATNTQQDKPIYYFFSNSSFVLKDTNSIGQIYVINSTNVTIRNVTLGSGIYLAFVVNFSIMDSIINDTYSTYGIYYYSSNSSAITNNTVTLMSNGGYGIQSASSSSGNITNNTINVYGNVSMGIALSATESSTIRDNMIEMSGESDFGLLVAGSNANNISYNTVFSSGTASFGINMGYSDANNFLNNTIVLLGGGGGAMVMTASNSNRFTNNTILAEGPITFGVFIDTSENNTLSGGSIMALGFFDYYLNSSATNNITGTNFTYIRTILFSDNISYFNYNNESAGNIWLKTNILFDLGGGLLRTLINWTQDTMRWNDTNMGPWGPMNTNYTILGLQPGRGYNIYNASGGNQTKQYIKVTDSFGNLPSFTLVINETTEILVTACTESWSYSDWGACSGGTQARTATDANTCGTTINRSAISQSCSSSPGSPSGGGVTPSTTKSITVTPKHEIEKVVVNLKQSLSSPSLTVEKIMSITVSPPQEPVYHYINITKNGFNNTQIENATIDFKVNKSWVLSNNFTKIYLSHYDNGWKKLKTDLLNSTATANYYRAYTSAFSYFAIIGERAAQASIPAVETPKEQVKEETKPPLEQTEAPQNAPVTEPEQKKPYLVYLVVALILFLIGYVVIRDR